MKKIIRSAYSERKPVHVRDDGQPSPTKQEFLKEVNINTIVSRMKNGISPPQWMTAATPRYGDFTDMPTSFQEAYALIETAELAFSGLPLEFRRALDHNPANLQNAPRELYEQFGLIKKSAPAEGATRPSTGSDNSEGSGDQGLSAKAPPGANKGSKKPAQNGDE